MKRIKTIKSYTLYTLLVAFLFCGCEEHEEKKEKNIIAYKKIEVITVRDCEYVLWYNGYGSDMEHYEGCKNKDHF